MPKSPKKWGILFLFDSEGLKGAGTYNVWYNICIVLQVYKASKQWISHFYYKIPSIKRNNQNPLLKHTTI